MVPLSHSPHCILLTGVTGFLGKVVLEELLRRREEYQLHKVILIIRPKRGKSSRLRFATDIASSLCFSELPKDWLASVQIVDGNLSVERCGVDSTTYEKICTEVTHIIHCAGSINFESPFEEAALANITTTLNVHKLAQSCSSLQRLVVTSTAYVMPHQNEPLYETIGTLPMPASDLLSAIRTGKLSDIDAMRLTGHPNTYTLTKCIAEHLLFECKSNFPITIVRPSIISASIYHPFPGWIDSYAAFGGFVTAFGAGVLHVIDGNPNTLLDVVPVDEVARVLIENALLSPLVVVYEKTICYAVAGLECSIEIRKASQIVHNFFGQRHSGGSSLRPRLNYLGPRSSFFYLQDFVWHQIPFSLAWYYHWMRGDAKMVKQTEQAITLVSAINRVFPHFVHNTYDFRPGAALLKGFDVEEYIKVVCEGVNKHLLKRAVHTKI